MSINSYPNLEKAIKILQKRGFTEVFRLIDDDLYGLHNNKRYATENVSIIEHHRFQQAEDSTKFQIVFAIICNDETKGYIISPEEKAGYINLLTIMDKVRVKKRSPMSISN